MQIDEIFWYGRITGYLEVLVVKFESMRFWFSIFLVFWFLFAHGATMTKPTAETTPAATDVPVTSSRAGTSPQQNNLGPVAQGAAQNGVRRCLPRIDQVVNFLSAGAQTGAMVFTAPADTDNRLSSVALEALGSNGLSYIDTGYAPNASGCDAMYQTITHWTNSCDEVARVAFPSFKKTSPLRQYVSVLDGGPSAKVFLMPAGAGCVSIKKEVLF